MNELPAGAAGVLLLEGGEGLTPAAVHLDFCEIGLPVGGEAETISQQIRPPSG